MESEDFYALIAEKCSLKQLTNEQANTAYRVRDQARLSFERLGKVTPSPYSELVAMVTWLYVQGELYKSKLESGE